MAVTELSGVGEKTAEELREKHGIETVSGFCVAVFGESGDEVSETLYSPLTVLRALYWETRESVPNSEFGLDRSRYRAIDVMMFIRVFGVRADWLSDEYFGSHDIESKYAVSPSDVVWSEGCVTNEEMTAGYAYWGIPWDFDEDKWESAKEVQEMDSGLVKFSRGETSSAVDPELLFGVEKITGCNYETDDLSDVKVHSKESDFPVLIFHDDIPGRYMVAPRL